MLLVYHRLKHRAVVVSIPSGAPEVGVGLYRQRYTRRPVSAAAIHQGCIS